MRSLSVLYLSSTIPGLLSVNQQLLGEIGPEAPISVPFLAGVSLQLTLLPLEMNVLPLTRILKAEADGLHSTPTGGITAVRWLNGFYQLTLAPQRLPSAQVLSPFPDVLRRETFTHNGLSCAANLVQYGKLWLTVEEGDVVVHETELPYCTAARELTVCTMGGAPVIAAAAAGEKGLLVQLLQRKNGWQRETPVYGTSMVCLPDRVTVEEPLGDTRRHIRRHLWKPETGWQHSVSLPDTPASALGREETVRELLEAVALSLEEEAMGCCTDSLRETLTMEALGDYLGNFDSLCPCPATLLRQGTVAIGLQKALSPGQYACMPFYFTLLRENETWKIDDIACWEEEPM